MDQARLEDLVMAAAERPSGKNLDKLLTELRALPGGLTAENTEALQLLWESWDEDNLFPNQATFCLELAGTAAPAGAAFRNMLAAAVKTLLPPYLNRTPFLRALGLRDDATPLHEIVWRFRKLAALKNGTIVFRNGTWGVAGAPDGINGTLPVSPYGSRGSAAGIPMELVLKEGIFLSPGLEINKITDPARAAAMTSADFRAVVKRRALTNVSDGQLKAMALASAGKNMTPEAFNAWWSAETPAPRATTGGRRACDGRSLTEIDLLLDKEAAAGASTFTEEEVQALTRFFTALKPETAAREALALAKVITKLQKRTKREDLAPMLSPLREKAPFWPADPGRASLEKLTVWGDIPAKDLEALATATAAVFEESYLAECALRLPLKALNAVCAAVDKGTLSNTLGSLRSCGSDLLMWIWKNRKKDGKELLNLVNVENVVRALSQEKLPKAWGNAQRELRTHLLDKDDFQRQLICSAADDAMAIAATLQGALFLSPGERQSLLVKLARHSEALRDYIENGAGQRILNAGLTAADKKVEVPTTNEPHYTSVRSHERLLKELDDIINIHTPENREALKVARAHGDFRENAEFDAAKERRNFLSRRRGELERELQRVQPVSFAKVQVDDTAVIGCRVDLADDEGEISTYYLLGAWDGNPEKNYLSYRTRLGQAILGHTKGEKINMPNGSERTIAAVLPLPPEILAEME